MTSWYVVDKNLFYIIPHNIKKTQYQDRDLSGYSQGQIIGPILPNKPRENPNRQL